MDILVKIEKLKNERNWSDYKLALEAGISYSTLASLKRRNAPPKIEILQQICDGFGITLAQFFLEDESIEILTDTEREVLNSYRKLPPKKQAALLNFMKN